MVETEHVDAELRLGIGSGCTRSASSKDGHKQQITIFYDGQIRGCDVTEIQARTIISLAKKETEQRHGEIQSTPFNQSQSSSAVAVAVMPKLFNPRLTMKHSLQQFLHKRKARISASAPYKRLPLQRSPLSTNASSL